MGACLSCCGGSDDREIYNQEQQSRRQQEARSYARSDTEADRAARTAAAQAAEARAAKFEQSAVGRAALKSVKAVKEERAQPPSRANNNIDDWRN